MYSQVLPCDLCLTISTPGERILWTRWTSQMRNVNHIPVFSPRREGYLSTAKLRLHTWENCSYKLRLEGGKGWQENWTFPWRESNLWPHGQQAVDVFFELRGVPAFCRKGSPIKILSHLFWHGRSQSTLKAAESLPWELAWPWSSF